MPTYSEWIELRFRENTNAFEGKTLKESATRAAEEYGKRTNTKWYRPTMGENGSVHFCYPQDSKLFEEPIKVQLKRYREIKRVFAQLVEEDGHTFIK